jgi:hypothetical protein
MLKMENQSNRAKQQKSVACVQVDISCSDPFWVFVVALHTERISITLHVIDQT